MPLNSVFGTYTPACKKMADGRVSQWHPYNHMLAVVCHHHSNGPLPHTRGSSSAKGPLFFGKLGPAWKIMSYTFTLYFQNTLSCCLCSCGLESPYKPSGTAFVFVVNEVVECFHF